MFRVMLCGASDTVLVAEQFKQVVNRMGGDAWHYLSGEIKYLNNAGSDFRRNSAASVAAADLLVFVIVARYGEISWDTELRAAIDDGKPLLVLCENQTYQAHLGADGQASPVDPRTLDLLKDLEINLSLTVVPFSVATFENVLVRQLSSVWKHALDELSSRNRRQALTLVLQDPERLNAHDLALTKQVALDELEDKQLRKRALAALAQRGGLDAESLLDLARSIEQGVARMVVDQLDLLHPASPPDRSLLEELVEIVGDSDDVGMPRRLVATLFRIDPVLAVEVLRMMPPMEVGTRRRIAQQIFDYKDAFAANPGPAILVLRRCVERDVDGGWLARAKALLAEMEDEASI